jgi:hypothetical protein
MESGAWLWCALMNRSSERAVFNTVARYQQSALSFALIQPRRPVEKRKRRE